MPPFLIFNFCGSRLTRDVVVIVVDVIVFDAIIFVDVIVDVIDCCC